MNEKVFRIFKRTWWKNNPSWPDGLEPCAGKKYVIGYSTSEEEARQYCQKWNASHNPGRFALRAEYESV